MDVITSLRRDTEFFFTVARIFADAVGATMTQLGNIKYIPAQERLSSYLLAETQDMGREMVIKTTRRQIADEIGMSIRHCSAASTVLWNRAISACSMARYA